MRTALIPALFFAAGACQTNFLFDDGTPLTVPFDGPASPTRLDTLAPGGSIHLLSTADPSAVGGWAQGQCTGPVKPTFATITLSAM